MSLDITVIDYWLLFVTSFLLVGGLTPLMRTIALRTNFIDSPNSSHKSHSEPVPYLGGVAIMFGVLITVYVALLLEGRSSIVTLASSVLLPALILGLIGLIDDKVSLPPFPRFIAQSFAGVITAWLMISSGTLGNPIGNTVADALVSILWVVLITNSVNFFDNVDGGASGSMAIVSAVLFAITLENGQVLIAGFSLVLLGSMLGFLLWNRSPARIYMGDAGSLFIGMVISVLTIRLNPQVESRPMSLAVPILVMAIPILDTTVSVFSRLRRRVSPFKGGRDHLSHRLMRIGFSKHRAVFSLWTLTALFAFSGALISTGTAYSHVLLTFVLIFWIVLAVMFLRVSDTD